MKNHIYQKYIAALLTLMALGAASPALAAKNTRLITTPVVNTPATTPVTPAVPKSDNSALVNVYALNNHLTPQQTQNALALAVGLGVVGLLLAQQDMLWRLYALTLRRAPVQPLRSSSSHV
jgi:hypothetical protein